jgi:hypothetical protein
VKGNGYNNAINFLVLRIQHWKPLEVNSVTRMALPTPDTLIESSFQDNIPKRVSKLQGSQMAMKSSIEAPMTQTTRQYQAEDNPSGGASI